MRTLSILLCALALSAGCNEKSKRSPHNGVLLLDGAAIPGNSALIESDCPELRRVLVQKNENGVFRIPLADFHGPCSIVLVATAAPAPLGN